MAGARGGPIVFAIAADTREFGPAITRAESDIEGLADVAQAEGRRVDAAFAAMGDATDEIASGASQVAGGLGDLGGALGMLPGPLGQVGAGMEFVGPAIMGVTGASDLMNAAVTRFPGLANVASVAARGLGAAMRFATGPVGLIVLALAAATAAIVLLWKRSETFRAIVTGVFNAVKSAGSTALSWLKSAWSAALNFITGPVGAAVRVISRNWDSIVNTVRGLPGRISSAASGMWDGIKGAFRSAINWVIEKWNNLGFDLPSFTAFGKTIGGGRISTPNIPYLAKGGVVDRATLAVIGEAGPEAVIPLDRLKDFGIGDAGARAEVYHITVNVPVTANPAEVGRQIVSAIETYKRAGGSVRVS